MVENRPRAAVILAAGRGTRMKSQMPKPLHPVGGRPMVSWAEATARAAGAERIVLVTGPDGAASTAALEGEAVHAVQDPPLGTGHAVTAALPALQSHEGVVLIIFGDTPLLMGATAAALCARAEETGLAILGFEAGDPGSYGRLIRGPDGALSRIVEARDASAEERAETLCNAGAMAADADLLRRFLPKLSNANAKGEYYLTDLISLAVAEGGNPAVEICAEEEALGVNSRAELARAEALFQARARMAAMEAGATLTAPETVFFAHDTALSPDVTVEPFVVFGPGVRVEAGATIRAHSHLEGAHVREGAVVGPFARLRPGADIGPGARVGNFVEVKKTRMGEGAKANHLAYLGDAEVGANANVGAGVVTCNYDGVNKHATTIGADAFIGTNSALVAPVEVGAGAFVAAGSVVTRDVGVGDFAIARPRQKTMPGAAEKILGAPKKTRG